MPWRETCTLDERLQFVGEYLKAQREMIELCLDFGISRKTGYKWLSRYKSDGPQGLHDRSRAPHRHPQAISDEVAQLLLAARRAHPNWGPRKLLALLKHQQPRLGLPAASTVGDLLKRYGVSEPRRRVRRVMPFTRPFASCVRPNDVWCADFKGHFRTGDRYLCYPLTVTDAYSRFILRCQGMTRPTGQGVWPYFEQAFREFGLPKAIRSDNGSPFATRGPHGFSRLSIWWLKLGITHERIKPGHPEQNGRHERMHRTLKQETAKPPRANLRSQQHAFDAFVEEFNYQRPHEAIDQRTPSHLFRPSRRPFPEHAPDFEYSSTQQVRKVMDGGRIRWKRQLVYVGDQFSGEHVGLNQATENAWEVWLGPARLGVVDHTHPKLSLIY
jgi:putative transposase